MSLLLLLYPFRLTPKRLVGTDILHAVPVALVGLIGHAMIGNIDVRLLGTLLVDRSGDRDRIDAGGAGVGPGDRARARAGAAGRGRAAVALTQLLGACAIDSTARS
ncbi:hypothetical protein AB5I41_19345 [Sphingomonas sp. MMS24-JH45]